MSFQAALEAFKKKIPIAYKVASRRLAELLLARIKELTPVDTGETRDAWKLEEGPDGYVIYNPLPHAYLLEHGSSEQAPNGMVQVAFTEAAAGTLRGGG